MFTAEFAELIFEIDNKYDYIENMCRDYITKGKSADFSISVTDEEIQKEQTEDFPLGYLESLAIYRKIAEILPDYNGLLMHGVLISAFDTGIIFLAKSGVGKSTHTMLWKKAYGENVKIINGDKPLIRVIDNTVYAYGTPWAGKENIHINTRTKLSKICFIERSETNELVPIFKNDALKRILNQVYMDKGYKALSVIDRIFKGCEFYIMRCNKDIEAAEVAYRGMIYDGA